MRSLTPLAIVSAALVSGSSAPHRTLPVAQPNPNLQRAGVLHDGVLTVTLEVKESTWLLNGSDRPPMTIEAFAEAGKAPLIPGPLVRAPRGTELRIAVRNSLQTPLTFVVPASIHGGSDQITAVDSIVVASGGVDTLRTRASVAGNYLYRAFTPSRAAKTLGIRGLGIVIDTAARVSSRDRVFVIMETPDSAAAACVDTARGNPLTQCTGAGRTVFTINGRSWPNTERVPAVVGDSLHWRVLNASGDVHPMHLHGFFFRVDGFSGPFAEYQGRPAPGQMVVTQVMTPFSTMSLTWSPDRPGNWLFHCHFALHLQPDSLSTPPDDLHMRGMVGLVLGVSVAGRPGVQIAGEPGAVRHLRLAAIADSVRRDGSRAGDVPSMRFLLEEDGHRLDTGRDFSPQLDLTRGEPVSIMIVNHLAEPTSVHWHGIEVEDSYMDGVPDFSGSGKHLTPAIAPGDSFLARFTPPRAGTFMYHAHVDELREQIGGLEGALIVRDRGDVPSLDDHVFFLKGDVPTTGHPLEINGQANPDTVVLRVGRAARFRLLNLSTGNPTPTFSLTARSDSAFANGRDTLIVRWRPIAKDAADLSAAAQAPRLARQLVSMGETYDFEYTGTRVGVLQLEIRASPPPGVPVPPRLLIRVPIRVEP